MMKSNMTSLAFLTERSWMDHDNQHVWTSHDCVNERVTTMLPWPKWRRVDNVISPSIDCKKCGAHYIGHLERTVESFHTNAVNRLCDPLDSDAPWPVEFPRSIIR